MIRRIKIVGVGVSLCFSASVGLTYWSFLKSYEDPTLWSVKSLSKCQMTKLANPAVLTEKQREQFDKEGFVVMKNVLPKEYVECLGCHATEYVERYRGVQKWFTRFSKRSAIHAPSHHAGFARNLTKNLESIGEICSELLHADETDPLRLVLDTLDIIPNTQASTTVAPFRRDSLKLAGGIRAWVPFQSISRASAPTVLVPQSHNWVTECQTGHFENNDLPTCPSFSDLMKRKDYWNTKIITDIEPGDVLFINTRVLHGWGPNTSPKTRLAMRLTIKPSSAKFYEPIKFSKAGPRELTQPQVWPVVEHKDDHWPIQELGFRDWLKLCLNIFKRSIMGQFRKKEHTEFKPVQNQDVADVGDLKLKS